MINKPFADIETADISYLVQEAIAEGRTLEYKQALPGNSNGDKKEFLADVSAFANASGGDLIYGVSEQRDEQGQATGIPQKIIGLEDINADAEIRRLDNIIRDGIEPRITVQIRAIEVSSSETIIILRIPNSFAAPHMVTFRTSRFYSRNNAGKYQLDVQEIRTAFLAAEALPRQISQFRNERLLKIVAGETPYPLSSGSPIVLHIVPISSFTDKQHVDISQAVNNFPQWFHPIDASPSMKRFNFDGVVTASKDKGQTVGGYLQVFRNGIIEATDTFILQTHKKLILITYLERELIKSLKHYFKLLQALEFEPPILLLLSLLNIKGFQILHGNERPRVATPIDRDSLILPDILIEKFSENTDIILQPLFDILWQSAGYERSLNYNKNGRWQGR